MTTFTEIALPFIVFAVFVTVIYHLKARKKDGKGFVERVTFGKYCWPKGGK